MAEISKIRTLYYEAGWSMRRIARELGHDRDTVSKYVKEDGAGEGGGSKPAIATAGNERPGSGRRSTCEGYRGVIEGLLEKGLSAERIWRELRDDHGFGHSYEAVKRFVRRLKASVPKRVWRMECEPGEEAQVDFGLARTLRTADGKLRYTNVLRVKLSFSRKGYTETLPSQSAECFIRALENAFRHFGGVPATLRVDNLKAAVKNPDWFDPELNPELEAFARHYGVAVIPTRPYRPEHKGKVESDVAYVKGSALKGNEFTSLAGQNAHLKKWERDVADNRVHGTTRKQVGRHFEESEKDALKPLPPGLFPCFQEALRRVHRDSYIEVARSYYQVPPEFIGRRLWVRWDSKTVRVFDEEMAVVASHVRLEPGRFSHCLGARGTRKNSAHHTSLWWIDRAALFGPSAERWAAAVAKNRPEHCIRVLQGLLSRNRGGKHAAGDIDRACAAAASRGQFHLRAVRDALALSGRPGAPATFQGTMPFLEEHTIIRPPGEYASLLEALTEP
jgi:transposase